MIFEKQMERINSVHNWGKENVTIGREASDRSPEGWAGSSDHQRMDATPPPTQGGDSKLPLHNSYKKSKSPGLKHENGHFQNQGMAVDRLHGPQLINARAKRGHSLFLFSIGYGCCAVPVYA